jgi:pyruvate formate-lyase activating enzyme-like uncharacterized protein
MSKLDEIRLHHEEEYCRNKAESFLKRAEEARLEREKLEVK